MLTKCNFFVTLKEYLLIKLKVLALNSGKSPYTEWLRALPVTTRVQVVRFVQRLALGGSKKNIKSLRGGLYELKVDIGPGYRVYFGILGDELIILLSGGIKRSQRRDIERARRLWREYVSNS